MHRMSTTHAEPSGRGCRLLIVGSDAFQRRQWASLRLASPAAWNIRSATDGAAGLALLRAERFDCVLLNFDLPDMTGYEFLSAAALEGDPPCTVVLVPGRGNKLPTVGLTVGHQPEVIGPVVVPADQPQRSGGILLVDDIEMNRDMISGMLRAAGHDVALAASGQEAVRLASEQAYDLILMDVRMPGMDGLEATRRIRSLPGPRSQVPILALTAYVLPVKIAQCRDAGMDGYVAKPVEYATLASAMSEAMAGRRRTAPAPMEAEGEGRLSPRFDRGRFETTIKYLPRDAAATSLELLHVRMEEMLRLLDRPGPPAGLTEAAHDLAPIAGTFGLGALSAASRRLEQAVADGAANLAQLREQALLETRAALAILEAVMSDQRPAPIRSDAEPAIA